MNKINITAKLQTYSFNQGCNFAQKFQDQLNFGFETFSQLLSLEKNIRFQGAESAILKLFPVIGYHRNCQTKFLKTLGKLRS